MTAARLLDIGTVFRQNMSEKLFRSEIDAKHFARMKSYPNGGYEIMACSKNVFREDGWEDAGEFALPGESKKRDRCEASAEDVERSLRRAASKVRDIALSNRFRWFVTLTLDQTMVDRYDMEAIMKRANVWLDNAVRRKGLAYVLVPERHKDGAVHFHGFFNDALRASESGHRDSAGHMIFNLPEWKFGFTAAIELYGSYESAVGYVCKYVRKQAEKIGGRWYYSGGKLAKPEISYPEISYRELEATGCAYTFQVPGAAFVIVRGGGDQDVEQGDNSGCVGSCESGD